jgi:membrane AbrB-like protein
LAGLIVGLAYALSPTRTLTVPRLPVVLAQAVIGVAAGSYVHRAAVENMADHWFPVLLGTITTIAASALAGIALMRVTGLDATTALFGVAAGGASGLTATSGAFGADDRLVGMMQYLRVLLVLGTIPLVAGLIFGVSGGDGELVSNDEGFAQATTFLVLCVVCGLALKRIARLPATGAIIGPMLVAAALTVILESNSTPPGWIQSIALATIGLLVGLRFTSATWRISVRILPAVVCSTVGLVVVCGLVGILIAPLAHASRLDGYLATSPGGLPAALGLVANEDADASFVISTQVLRVFLILLVAPLASRLVMRVDRNEPSASG